MITKLRFRWFKSIEDVEFDPGPRSTSSLARMEAVRATCSKPLAFSSAAVHGRVDDEALLRRGVRPGVPALYKCAFSDMKRSKYIYFGRMERFSVL